LAPLLCASVRRMAAISIFSHLDLASSCAFA
jgi:hypothetical protein